MADNIKVTPIDDDPNFYPNGTPKLQPYNSLLGPGGTLQSQYQLNAGDDVAFTSNLQKLQDMLAGINVDKTGINAYRARATGTGPSAWAEMMLQRQGIEEAMARDKAMSGANAAKGAAFNSLATRGGLSTGSRERVAEKAMLGLMKAKQDVGRQGSLDRLGIQTTDEQQKLDLLKGLPQAEVTMLQPELQKTNYWGQMADAEAQRKQALDVNNRDYRTSVQKSNIDTLLKNWAGQNDYTTTKYSEQMKLNAADKTANAIRESGGGMSWICTEVDRVSKLPARHWDALRQLKEYSLETDKKRSAFYFKRCKLFWAQLVRDGYDFSQHRPFVDEVVKMVQFGQMTEAVARYWREVRSLLKAEAPELHAEYLALAEKLGLAESYVPTQSEIPRQIA